MDIKENKINDREQVLDQLYESSTDELKGLYIEKYGEPMQAKKVITTKNELKDMIEKIVKDKEQQSKLLKKVDKFEENFFGEMFLWEKEYYKLGVLDGISLRKELKEKQEVYKSNKEQTNCSSFFYNYLEDFLQFIEYNRYNIWSKREDYKETINKMSDIKKQYPKVRNFFEENIVTDLSKEDANAILEYISLQNEIELMEQKEIFKLGLKET